jgi:hypothetical protein
MQVLDSENKLKEILKYSSQLLTTGFSILKQHDFLCSVLYSKSKKRPKMKYYIGKMKTIRFLLSHYKYIVVKRTPNNNSH